jgi:hypothetical protein
MARRGQIQGNECKSLIDHRSIPGAAFSKPGLGNTNQASVWLEAGFASRLMGGMLGMLAKTLSIDRLGDRPRFVLHLDAG